MKYQDVLEAIQQGGSVNKAAQKLGVHPQTLTLWIAKKGYEVVHFVTLRPIAMELTDKGVEAVAAMKGEGVSNG